MNLVPNLNVFNKFICFSVICDISQICCIKGEIMQSANKKKIADDNMHGPS